MDKTTNNMFPNPKNARANATLPTDDEAQNEAEEGADDEARAVSPAPVEFRSSIIRSATQDDNTVPLWLVMFTDVMALMLTFFVLLYSMSVPEEDKWNAISRSLKLNTSVFDAKAFNAGSQDAISIDKISTKRALDLGYIKTLIDGLLKKQSIDNVILTNNEKRLIISLPSELLFQSGQTDIGIEGKKLIFELSGILARVKNRIEIVGHTDPRPVTGQTAKYKTNWELSLARSIAVAKILRNVGYTRSMTVRGVSSTRFDELPDMDDTARLALSRRVDIVVMYENGFRKNAFETP